MKAVLTPALVLGLVGSLAAQDSTARPAAPPPAAAAAPAPSTATVEAVVARSVVEIGRAHV